MAGIYFRKSSPPNPTTESAPHFSYTSLTVLLILLREVPPKAPVQNKNPKFLQIVLKPMTPEEKVLPFFSMDSTVTDPLLLPFSTRSPLPPLPELDEISVPITTVPTSSSPLSLKDLLIFGDPTTATATAAAATSSSPPASPTPPPSWHTKTLHRSRTAPAMSPCIQSTEDPSAHPPALLRPSIVRQSLLLLSAYLLLGTAVYSLLPSHFSSSPTHPVVDGLYFCIVTMCTIGYGDITPSSPLSKLLSVTFVLFAFGFLDILLSSLLSHLLHLQETLLLSSPARRHRHPYLVDLKKGRIHIRMKVALALFVVFLCIGVGTFVLRFMEDLGWLDSFYLSVMSVTTVGYGDRAFKTMGGRLFASVWLLVSTLAVARGFLYLAEARVDRRHRQIAKWVLARDMTISEFLAADIDNNGFVSKSEFVIYKLKEMGKIAEKDILQICDQFDRLDAGNFGKITLSDLTESHHH